MNFRKKKVSFYILGFLVFLNILALNIVLDLKDSGLLKVYFFDVGQGDSIFIITPQNHRILIDGGPNSKILERLGDRLPFWDKTIDLMILTHPDKDHLAGLIEVLKFYKVENVLWTGVLHDTALYEEWVKLLDKKNPVVNIAKSGQKIKLISEFNYFIYFDILYPFDSLLGKEQKASNENSVVARLVFNDVTFLFTGDMIIETEKDLIYSNAAIESDVLKVAHHGSKNSTSDLFLEKVSPEVAVIQVGKNSYGHPAPEVLERLEKFGIKVLRSDIDSNIKIISNGKDYAISNF